MVKFIFLLTLFNLLIAIFSYNMWNIVFAIFIFMIGKEIAKKWACMN